MLHANPISLLFSSFKWLFVRFLTANQEVENAPVAMETFKWIYLIQNGKYKMTGISLRVSLCLIAIKQGSQAVLRRIAEISASKLCAASLYFIQFIPVQFENFSYKITIVLYDTSKCFLISSCFLEGDIGQLQLVVPK